MVTFGTWNLQLYCGRVVLKVGLQKGITHCCNWALVVVVMHGLNLVNNATLFPNRNRNNVSHIGYPGSKEILFSITDIESSFWNCSCSSDESHEMSDCCGRSRPCYIGQSKLFSILLYQIVSWGLYPDSLLHLYEVQRAKMFWIRSV